MKFSKAPTSQKYTKKRYLSESGKWEIGVDSKNILSWGLVGEPNYLARALSREILNTIFRIFLYVPESSSKEVVEALIPNLVENNIAEEILADLIIANL